LAICVPHNFAAIGASRSTSMNDSGERAIAGLLNAMANTAVAALLVAN